MCNGNILTFFQCCTLHSTAWPLQSSPICFLRLRGKVWVHKISTPKMSTLRMSTPRMSTPKMSTFQNVNSQNVNSPKILPKSTVWVISQPVRPFHKQEVLITIKLTWDGVTQELEKMDNLEDFKTYLGSYRYDDSKSLPLWNYYTYNESDHQYWSHLKAGTIDWREIV